MMPSYEGGARVCIHNYPTHTYLFYIRLGPNCCTRRSAIPRHSAPEFEVLPAFLRMSRILCSVLLVQTNSRREAFQHYVTGTVCSTPSTLLSALDYIVVRGTQCIRKVRPSTFQPLRLRPLSGARQPCSDWLDAKHLAIVLIHLSRQGFSS